MPTRAARTEEASEAASIGSPSAVPVPCASMQHSEAAPMQASANAANSNERCACPFGAVRLALLPSCRTQLPSTEACCEASPALSVCTVKAQHASLRAYPSARRSNVLQLPVADVMPATAKLTLTCGSNIMLTPATRAFGHSPSWSARNAAWPAADAAEHAVSYDTHGP